MKKIILTIMVFFIIMPNVSAVENTNLEYTNSALCNYDYSACYPVYHITISGKEAFFLNYSENYNLNFADYYPIAIEDTSLPTAIFEYAHLIPFIRINGTYYKEVMQQKIWELIYDEPFEITMNHEDFDIIRQMNDFEYMLDKIRKGPSFINEVASFSSGEIYHLKDENLYLFDIKKSDHIKANNLGSYLAVSGPSGIYNLTLSLKNSNENLPVIYTDGTNYLITEGAITKEFTTQIQIDMKNVSLKFSPTLANEEINIYHNDTLYKKINLTEDEMNINTLLPMGEIKITDSSGKEIRTFIVNDDMSLNISSSTAIFKPDNFSGNVTNTNPSKPFKPILKPNINDKLVTIDKNENEIKVLLPDTLCI